MTCEATTYHGRYPGCDAFPCGNPSVGICKWCGMECCEEHFEDGYCAGDDCRDQERREANAAMLLQAWRIGEMLP